jgi:DNA-binding SARP family transcriptional activator/TolB-like protein
MPAASKLEMNLLGMFSLRLGANEIRIPSRKGCALVGYLALVDGHEATREQLLGLLWSDSSEDKARASLRQVLHEIQSTFKTGGFAGFHSDRLTLRLSPESVTIDLLEMLRLAGEGHAHPKLFGRQRATESLLRDLEATDPAFTEWVTAKRQSLHEQLVHHLTTSLRRLPPGSNQLELSRAILHLEPTHEEAARNIIRAQASVGDVGGALRSYKNLWDLLENEYDVEPVKETQELIAAIKLGKPVAVAALEMPRTVVVAQSEPTALQGAGQPTLQQMESFIRTLIAPYGGRLSAGEHHTFVLDFPDPRAAVRASLGMAAGDGEGLPRSALQMGAHTSDNLGERRDSAKAVAGELAVLAKPGELLVSDQVRDVLTDGFDALIEDTGTDRSSGMSPRRAFRVAPPDERHSGPQEDHIHPVVAIIPFELASKQTKHLLVGEVLAEELIASFCAAKELAVISRMSTRAFRGRSSSLQELRDRLRANYVLSGTYNIRGNSVELRAEFADARSETVLWRRDLKASLAEILSGNAEFVGELVAEVGASVLMRELDRARSRPLETLENYSLLMAAITLSHRTSPNSFAQARSLLELLVERLPLHPVPLAWLAKWHVFKINQGWSQDRDADAQVALQCATRAIESDPASSIALTVDAWANLSLGRRYDIAEQRFEQAVGANPSDSTAWLLKGMMHAFKGQGGTAVAAAERAVRLSPLDPRRSYYDSLAATAYLSAGDFERAIELAQRSLRVDRLHASTLRALAIAQQLSGRAEDARQTLATLLKLDPTLTVGKYLSRHPAAEFSTGRLWADALGKAGLPK